MLGIDIGDVGDASVVRRGLDNSPSFLGEELRTALLPPLFCAFAGFLSPGDSLPPSSAESGWSLESSWVLGSHRDLNVQTRPDDQAERE